MSSTNRGLTRIAADFYPTPPSAFAPLIPFLDAKRSHWEPACGDGRLVMAMRDARIDASGADLEQDHFAQGLKNFLSDYIQRDVILTNPPFSLAQEFVEHGLKHSRELWLLLRLNFLGAQKRRAWWSDGREPNALFILSERPRFSKNKLGKLGNDSTEYAWFYWGRRHQGIKHL